MTKKLAICAIAAAVLAAALLAGCATDRDQRTPPVAREPIAPTDLNPATFDDFDVGFASPLNGHNGIWGNNLVNDGGLGFWYGGESSESMVFYDLPPAGQPAPFNNRVSTFGLASVENSWGRVFRNAEGTPTPLGAPDAIGVSFWAHEIGVAFLNATWVVYVRGGVGDGETVASLEFQITAPNQWQEFFVEFPEGFRSDWITGYDFWMRAFTPAVERSPTASSGMSIAQMMFVYPDSGLDLEE